MKGGVALEGPDVGRKQAEPDRTAAVAIIDAVDQRGKFLAPIAVRDKQVRLVVIGGHQVEQHHADAERLIARHPLPELLEAGEQESGVARLKEIGFVPPAAEIAGNKPK